MRRRARVWGLLALARHVHAQMLPYNPTQLSLLKNHSTIYMLRPAAQAPHQAQLLTLDFTNTLESSRLPWATASETLPFLRNDEAVPYLPTVEDDGSITVLTGNCSDGANGLEVWRYLPQWSKQDANTWNKISSSTTGIGSAGPQYLAASLAFSEYVDDAKTQIYSFAGMCPSITATADTWQTSADYSSAMLSFSPGLNGDMVDSYTAQLLLNQGPPIPQAGMSLTPLFPTYSLSSTGAPQTAQQDFVLLGGHTQAAFINMSQVAVFSLPQQTWSFMPVQQPTDAKSDLARRATAEVTPRSGHSAVLTEDGNGIVLFGGWVGDVNTPATPQLAVLKLGDGYGGSGDWKWYVPDSTGHGLSTGAGIYGHGAVMLPGGVMMVAGGYEIPSSAASRRTKRAAQIGSSRNLFYNTTSNAWLTSYSIPHGYEGQPQQSSGPLGSQSKKVGLGAGLGVGAAILVTVVALYFWYSKRVKRAREDRQRALLVHSSDGSSVGQIDQPFLDQGGIDGRGGDHFALGRFWSPQAPDHNAMPRPPPMQHTTGMFVNMPSPTRGLRRGVGTKNFQYQPAPRYDDKRAGRGSSNIHPIAELDNEDEAVSIHSDREQLDDAEAKLKELERVLNSADPFQDPSPNPLGSHPVSPIAGPVDMMHQGFMGAGVMPPRKPVPSRQESPNWSVAPGAESDDGRVSPLKSGDRTSSTLSDVSALTTISNGSITRTMSTRTGALLAAAMAAQRRPAGIEVSPTYERSQTMSTEASYFTPARSSTNGSMTHGGADTIDRDSWPPAKSSFAQLQSESEALLGARHDRDDPYQRALAASNSRSAKPSPSTQLVPRRTPGWVGSLRRALNVLPVGERSFSLTSQYKDNDPRSSSSSPTKEVPTRHPQPRRAISDGGALLKQKRGESDWKDEKAFPPYHDHDDDEDWGEPRREMEEKRTAVDGDWDVEGAAMRRDFQVMFTVPKARLRVVNDDMDRASLRSVSEGAGVSRRVGWEGAVVEES